MSSVIARTSDSRRRSGDTSGERGRRPEVIARTNPHRWTHTTKRCVVLVGIAALAMLGACSDARAPEASSTTPAPTLSLPDLTNHDVAVTERATEPPGPAATDPASAVDTFVAAEANGDFATSFGLLSDDDRGRLHTEAQWVSVHASMPTLRSFDRQRVLTMDGQADVIGTARFEPSLDEVRGLVPATGDATWRTVAEDGGWRVAFGQTRIRPRYANAAALDEVVKAWADSRQRCEAPGPSLQYDGGLVGATGLVDRLCGSTGAVRTGRTADLGDRVEADAVLASFGPESDLWAKVVPLQAPVAMDVVLAPLGDHWIVVAALAPA
jgi:hypothetical protein